MTPNWDKEIKSGLRSAEANANRVNPCTISKLIKMARVIVVIQDLISLLSFIVL
jgi:hypothetical protein